jgi:pilus assembly protein CpaF
VFELMAEEATPVSMAEREQILSDILDEVFGLGPLEPLLRDPNINDILVNTFKQVYIERAGVLTKVPTTFQDDRHLLRVIDRIVSASAGAVDDSSPMVDARLADGLARQRDHPATGGRRSAALDPALPKERLKGEDLVPIRAMTRPMLDFLGHCVRARLNCLIAAAPAPARRRCST